MVDIDATQSLFLEARGGEMPFEVIVIHPVAARARLQTAPVVSRDLPRDAGCSPRTLWRAVDLESDGKTDVAVFRSCCDKPATPSLKLASPLCEFNCQRIFLRWNDHPWRLVHEGSDF
jgi:hypothetical protein